MITSWHHVELNGVPYRLAESAEGEHYIESGEPLRPPNSQVVQGATQTQFQMRPDTLVWLIDSWSGGSGQIRFDPENPDRHRLIFNADGITDPGKLKMGWRLRTIANTPGIGAPISNVVRFFNRLYVFFDTGTANTGVSLWDQQNKVWESFTGTTGADAAEFLGALTNPAQGHFLLALYEEDSVGPVAGFTLTSGATVNFGAFSQAFPDPTTDEMPVVLGDYFYAIDHGQNVVELLATSPPGSTTPTTVFTWSGYADHLSSKLFLRNLTKADNRAYFYAHTQGGTLLFELTPTTAAGPASASQVLYLRGVYLYDMVYAAGLLIMTTNTNSVYYYQPGGSYGIIKGPDDYAAITPDATDNAGMTDRLGMAFDGRMVYWLFDAGAGDGIWHFFLYCLDIASGNWQIVSRITRTNLHLLGAEGPDAIFYPEHRLWFSDHSTDQALYMDNTQAEFGVGNRFGWALTPWHSFGVGEAKQLMSVRVKHNMSSDWKLMVYARRNGDDDTETLLGTITGDDGPASTTLTPTIPYPFGLLALRLTFFSDPGDEDAIPEITAVEIRATVTQEQRMWRLLLDAANDEQGVTPSRSGAAKIANIKTLADNGTPFTFNDGYLNRNVGESTSYNVVIDSYSVIADRAGEATIAVTLREQS